MYMIYKQNEPEAYMYEAYILHMFSEYIYLSNAVGVTFDVMYMCTYIHMTRRSTLLANNACVCLVYRCIYMYMCFSSSLLIHVHTMCIQCVYIHVHCMYICTCIICACT